MSYEYIIIKFALSIQVLRLSDASQCRGKTIIMYPELLEVPRDQ